MGFGNRNKPPPIDDSAASSPLWGGFDNLSTDWMSTGDIADFLLMNTKEIRYMCLFGYCFFHGCKVFSLVKPESPFAFKFVTMILACTGGGIFVPILLNAYPVPLAQDAFIIAILWVFSIHNQWPVLREVFNLSPILKSVTVCLFEIFRAFVVTKFTLLAAEKIPSSEFSFPLFGPIFCGTISGCGGAFFPLSKGLEPIAKGLPTPMWSAFVGATCYHLFLNTSLSDDIDDAPKKGHFAVAVYFIIQGLMAAFQTPPNKSTK